MNYKEIIPILGRYDEKTLYPVPGGADLRPVSFLPQTGRIS